MSRVQKGPTTTQSWKLWCLALAALRYSPDELAELFRKQPHNEKTLLTRMSYLRQHRAIPIVEFL